MRRLLLLVTLALSCATWTEPGALPRVQAAPASEVRIQLLKAQPSIHLTNPAALTLENGQGRVELPPGAYTLSLEAPAAARQRFHAFSKTFPLSQRAEAAAYLAEWRARGLEPEIVECGRLQPCADGTTLDNRIVWISLARFDTRAEAEAFKKRLEAQQTWVWLRNQATAPGKATAHLRADAGGGLARLEVPFRFTAPLSAPVTIRGATEKDSAAKTYTGALSVEVGFEGKADVYVRLPLDAYLMGVVPSEMPASWPAEALRAQAVTARSFALAHLGLKHELEGFDFCSTTECKVYNGHGARAPATEAAVADTAGLVIAQGSRIVPAVFHSNGGGWTEANETVWSAPPDAALRPVPELAGGAKPPQSVAAYGLARWLTAPPKAYGASDTRYFRWRQEFTPAELTRAVNKRYPVGEVQRIELGERGEGGRLKWVKVVGSKDRVTIHKEGPIRQALGSLPSAMFILDKQGPAQGDPSYVFIGAGRGHGVGLSQYGAYDMAKAGARYEAIVRHYFTNVELRKVLLDGSDQADR